MILLDTHVLIWLNVSPRKLSQSASSAIRRARTRDGLAVSAMTLLELSRLIGTGRIDRIGTVQQTIEALIRETVVRPITTEIAALCSYLPADFPSDPADRAIAATAQAENIPLVTADERILNCRSIKTIW